MGVKQNTDVKMRLEEARKMVYVDIINGVPYQTILFNLMNSVYVGHDYSQSRAYHIIADAYKKIKKDYEGERENARSLLMSRYLDLYNDAKDNNDRQAAKGCLDSIMKLTGANEPEKIDLNSKVDVQIKFGLKEEEEVIDEESED